MPLETATYLTDLVPANPAHTDPNSQADSHSRLIKAVLKATFPNFTSAALASTQAQIDASVASVTGTAYLRHLMGTVALPGITPVGDPDTGMWSPAANTLAWSCAGVEVLRSDSSTISTARDFSSTALVQSARFAGGTGQLVPIGSTLIWWDDVLPAEGGYAWANGQIIASANTVCPVLLARWGTRFGGNGLTTMGVPDLRDTVPVGKSTMGAVASRALQTLTNTVLGTLIGAANYVLSIANLPAHTHANTLTDPGHTHNITGTPNYVASTAGNGNYDDVQPRGGVVTGHVIANTTGITLTNASVGSGTSMSLVQPSTTCNYIIRLA